ncbi:hypothetical protein L208DRAFT_1364878 [Tricholoma matsutake]|nr:hypothetical protein L208DRAFT_1364878 [Tricholoma matsutake 945]
MTLLLHYWLVLLGDPFLLFAVYFLAYQWIVAWDAANGLMWMLLFISKWFGVYIGAGGELLSVKCCRRECSQLLVISTKCIVGVD